MKYSILFVCLCFFFACETNAPEENTEEAPQEQEPTTPAEESAAGGATLSQGSGNNKIAANKGSSSDQVKKLYQEKLSDGKVSFDVMCRNGETSKFQILGAGFEREGVKFNGAVEGQLTNSHLLDLNQDGYSEIYLVFNMTDDSGNKMIKGYSSYTNKSAGEIYIKDTDKIRQVNTDKVYVENKKLMRSFKDENGNDVSFEYKLEKGESSFVLTPNKVGPN